MSRALVIAAICLALAAPAAAQQGGRIAPTTARPSADALALRGPLTADPLAARAGRASPGEQAPAEPAPADLLAPLPQTSGASAGQCRQSCARSYYFCLAADTGEDCGSNWAQCRSACNDDGAASSVGARATP